MTVTPDLPVLYGSTVTLSCEEGYVRSGGSEEALCLGDTTFQFTNGFLECVEEGEEMLSFPS